MREPKITMNTVRVALQLTAHLGPVTPSCLLLAMLDAAALGRIARRVRRLNEADCNLGSGDARRDAARDRLVQAGDAIARLHGATFHPFGQGGGLWPRVDLAAGGSITP